MTRAALKNFNFTEFNNVPPGSIPDYTGDGEVLDIIAKPDRGYIKSEVDTVDMLISEETYENFPPPM
jgi:hypothetical protein